MDDYARIYTRGRGSNPRSRKNLTGPIRDTFVFRQEANGTWTKLAGPFSFHVAYRRAEKLNGKSSVKNHVASIHSA